MGHTPTSKGASVNLAYFSDVANKTCLEMDRIVYHLLWFIFQIAEHCYELTKVTKHNLSGSIVPTTTVLKVSERFTVLTYIIMYTILVEPRNCAQRSLINN